MRTGQSHQRKMYVMSESESKSKRKGLKVIQEIGKSES